MLCNVVLRDGEAGTSSCVSLCCFSHNVIKTVDGKQPYQAHVAREVMPPYGTSGETVPNINVH